MLLIKLHIDQCPEFYCLLTTHQCHGLLNGKQWLKQALMDWNLLPRAIQSPCSNPNSACTVYWLL